MNPHAFFLRLCAILGSQLEFTRAAIKNSDDSTFKGNADYEKIAEKYAPMKSCRYHFPPHSWDGYLDNHGEAYVGDVFGMPKVGGGELPGTIKVKEKSVLTMSGDLHRDNSASVEMKIYASNGEDVVKAVKTHGNGGSTDRAMLQVILKPQETYKIIIDIEDADSSGGEQDDWCIPVRIDMQIIPFKRDFLHFPQKCTILDPPTLGGGNHSASYKDHEHKDHMTDLATTLPVVLEPRSDTKKQPYAFRMEGKTSDDVEDEEYKFGRVLWHGLFDADMRMHRFVRFKANASSRFSSGAVTLVLELFERSETPTDPLPQCQMGCVSGTPIFNGVLIDHAMPSGFKYKLWVLAAIPIKEWRNRIPSSAYKCIEYDFNYHVTYETVVTHYEVGVHAWNCDGAILPKVIHQTQDLETIEESTVLAGRNIFLRDKFTFSHDSSSDMEESINIKIAEDSLIRVTTHDTQGIDLRIVLTDSNGKSVCRSVKHEGLSGSRYSIACKMKPGNYVLKLLATYPVAGIHPCNHFHAHIGITPIALINGVNAQCDDSISGKLIRYIGEAEKSTAKWSDHTVKVKFRDSKKAEQKLSEKIEQREVIWSEKVKIPDSEALKKPYLKLVVLSDYITGDFRFQVKDNKDYVASGTMLSNGYNYFIGPLTKGDYTVELYYIPLEHDKVHICAKLSIDARAILRRKAGEDFLCKYKYPELPERIAPQSGEIVHLYEEYMLPTEEKKSIELVIPEGQNEYLVKVTDRADSPLSIRISDETTGKALYSAAVDTDVLAVFKPPGKFLLTIVKNEIDSSSEKEGGCKTMKLNILLHPSDPMPTCKNSSERMDKGGLERALVQEFKDAVPTMFKKRGKTTKMNDPVMAWVSPQVKVNMPLSISASTELRVEVTMVPPWIPMTLKLVPRAAESRLGKPATALATAELIENRLLLIASDVSAGEYEIRFSKHEEMSDKLANEVCAHVTVRVDMGLSSEDDRNDIRAELLDIPALQAIAPMPRLLNQVGWFDRAEMVASIIFGLHDKSSSLLVLKEPILLRIANEPSVLHKGRARIKIENDSGNKTLFDEATPRMSLFLEPGTYRLHMTGLEPFIVTLGLSPVKSLQEDVKAVGSITCPRTVELPEPELKNGRWPDTYRLGPKEAYVKHPAAGVIVSREIVLTSPAVVSLSTWSSYVLDEMRIGIRVPEGLWVGEQRGRVNQLMIELQSGTYQVEISEVAPPKIPGAPAERCGLFTAMIEVVSFASKKDDDNEGVKEMVQDEEEGACWTGGSVPLPLDLLSKNGGSLSMGGPMQRGRVLIRTHAMLTNMHDGRKSIALTTSGLDGDVILKIGVVIAGHSRRALAKRLRFRVHQGEKDTLVEAVGSWASDEQGWEKMYFIESSKGNSKVVFHHDHNVGQTACVHFDTVIMAVRRSDVSEMISCTNPPFPVVTVDTLFPKLPPKMPASFHVHPPAGTLNQKVRGFVSFHPFEVENEAWIIASISFNFFISHMEVDIVNDDKTKDKNNPTIEGMSELEFNGDVNNPLNVRQWIGVRLQRGHYVLRIADDHIKKQADASSEMLCAPLKMEFMSMPLSRPSILSIHPNPSFPLPFGSNVQITIRFSEPPEHTKVEDVAGKVFLDGIPAKGGQNWTQLGGKKTYQSIEKGREEEGAHVWVLTWDSSKFRTGGSGSAKKLPLTFKNLRTGSGVEFEVPPWEHGVVYKLDGKSGMENKLWVGGKYTGDESSSSFSSSSSSNSGTSDSSSSGWGQETPKEESSGWGGVKKEEAFSSSGWGSGTVKADEAAASSSGWGSGTVKTDEAAASSSGWGSPKKEAAESSSGWGSGKKEAASSSGWGTPSREKSSSSSGWGASSSSSSGGIGSVKKESPPRSVSRANNIQTQDGWGEPVQKSTGWGASPQDSSSSGWAPHDMNKKNLPGTTSEGEWKKEEEKPSPSSSGGGGGGWFSGWGSSSNENKEEGKEEETEGGVIVPGSVRKEAPGANPSLGTSGWSTDSAGSSSSPSSSGWASDTGGWKSSATSSSWGQAASTSDSGGTQVSKSSGTVISGGSNGWKDEGGQDAGWHRAAEVRPDFGIKIGYEGSWKQGEDESLVLNECTHGVWDPMRNECVTSYWYLYLLIVIALGVLVYALSRYWEHMTSPRALFKEKVDLEGGRPMEKVKLIGAAEDDDEETDLL